MALADEVRLVWVADASKETAATIGSAFGVRGVCCTRPEELPEADVVAVAIPWGARTDYLKELAARGAAAYVEKPIARTRLEHTQLLATFGPSRIADGLQRRSSGAVKAATELVQAGPFGALLRVRTEVGGPGVVVGSRYAADIRLAGGGILFEVAVHGIDAAFSIVQATELGAGSSRVVVHRGFDVDTEASFEVKRSDGTRVQFDLVASVLRETSGAMHLDFEHAKVKFSIFGFDGFHVTTKSASWLLHPERPIWPVTGYAVMGAHWKAFLGSVRSGVTSIATADQSLVTTDLIEAVYRSANILGDNT